MEDHVDRVLAQWRAEKPELDVSPMAVIGRLSRAAIAVDSRIEATLAAHGLDAATFDVLATLLRSGEPHRISPAELSQDAMISTSAVAQRLNKLEQRGLVSREANPSDGRGTLVTLTERGKNLVESALPHHLDTEHRIIETLTAVERTQLATMLSKIFEAATSARANPASAPTTGD